MTVRATSRRCWRFRKRGLTPEGGLEPSYPIPHRRHAHALPHPRLVAHFAFPAVELHDALAIDALAQILIGRADDRLFDAGDPRGARRGRRERVIRLELLHRPDPDAHLTQCVLERMKLRQQLRFYALARFVSGPEVVAERLDDVIGRDAEVGCATLEHALDRAQYSHDGRDLVAIAALLPRHRVEMAEQLVCAIEQMNTHLNQRRAGLLKCPNKSSRTVGSRSLHTTPSGE